MQNCDQAHVHDIRFEAIRLNGKDVTDAFRRAESKNSKATGEEMLDLSEDVAVFSVVQNRPFNNEVKLVFPNTRTEFRANSIVRTGDDLLVGFELISYKAKIRVTEICGLDRVNRDVIQCGSL